MSTEREETFAIEIPVPSHAPLVTRVERSSGKEVYLGLALDLTDDHNEGSYRVALTPAEARDLHTALGAALAETSTRS